MPCRVLNRNHLDIDHVLAFGTGLYYRTINEERDVRHLFDREATPPPVAPLVEIRVCRWRDHGIADVQFADRADAVQGVEEPQWAFGGESGVEPTPLHAGT